MIPIGCEAPFTLNIHPSELGEGQKVWVELGYDISGSGNHEGQVVTKVACFAKGWHAGVPQEETGTLRIPLNSPVSFHGMHMRVSWRLTIRHDIPWRKDQRQTFEVVVVPGSPDELQENGIHTARTKSAASR